MNPIPPGYEGVTSYLIIRDADKAIDFYKEAFEAKEVMRLDYPDGKVAHAELKIGGGYLMLSEEMASMNLKGPLSLGGTPVSLLVYVRDVDKVFDRAIAAGAENKRPVADQFYGDRSGTLVDPFGHVWTIATHTKDMSPRDMQKAMESEMEKPKADDA
ncbi:MAG TPA: VOC family protein [Casimicrobiaceae bacterium]|nr:VOC family protein [Casimicrobiaceae bacterium]